MTITSVLVRSEYMAFSLLKRTFAARDEFDN